MTDDVGASGADAPKEPGAGDAMQKAMADITSGMSNTEKMIALGAVLFLAICAILGELILDDYNVTQLELVLGAGALLAILRHNKGNSAWHSLYPWILEALAGAFAAVGVCGFIEWLLDGFEGLEGADVFYNLVFWAAVGLMGYGAWQLHRAHD